MKKLLLPAWLFCTLFSMSAQNSYLSFSILSPPAYGQTSIGFERFTKSHISYGVSTGYMHAIRYNYKWFDPPLYAVKGGYGAISAKVYIRKLNAKRSLNIFGGINAIASSLTQYDDSYNGYPHSYNICGLTICSGLTHNLIASGKFKIEYGVNFALINSLEYSEKYYSVLPAPGLGYIDSDQNKYFRGIGTNRRPMYFINLQVKLNKN